LKAYRIVLVFLFCNIHTQTDFMQVTGWLMITDARIR